MEFPIDISELEAVSNDSWRESKKVLPLKQIRGLERENIDTFEKLEKLCPHQIMSIRNFGVHSVKTIRAWLKAHNKDLALCELKENKIYCKNDGYYNYGSKFSVVLLKHEWLLGQTQEEEGDYFE